MIGCLLDSRRSFTIQQPDNFTLTQYISERQNVLDKWSDISDLFSPASNVIFEKQPSCSCLVRSSTRGHKTPEMAL